MLPLLNAVLRAVLPAPADFLADVVTDSIEHVPGIVRAAKDPVELEDELFAFFEDVLDDLPFIETADAVELASGAVTLVGVLTKACRQAKPRPWRARRRGVA